MKPAIINYYMCYLKIVLKCEKLVDCDFCHNQERFNSPHCMLMHKFFLSINPGMLVGYIVKKSFFFKRIHMFILVTVNSS